MTIFDVLDFIEFLPGQGVSRFFATGTKIGTMSQKVSRTPQKLLWQSRNMRPGRPRERGDLSPLLGRDRTILLLGAPIVPTIGGRS